MSDSQTTPTAPRRSQREKKAARPFISVGTKRKHDSDTDDDDAEPNGGSPVRDDEEEDYVSPKLKMKTSQATSRKGKSKAQPKAKGQSPAKKARTTNGPEKPTKPPATRKSKKEKAGNDAFNVAQVVHDTKISGDNPLFNAIINPASTLQSTAEDFLESLTQTPGAAQAELINLILRACGCNDSVDADQALDYDGVVDALDNFTEGLKKDDTPVYPLTSKIPIFKNFRKYLSEFIDRLITSSADFGSLYSTELMPTLQTWVIAMSSSQIRSFRHTATVVALEVETALCEVAAAVEKEAEVVGRQREGEKRRKASNKGGGVRDKELEGKAEEVRERRTQLAEFIKEFVDGVFVHRYRDLDPNIRAECVRSIGLWFKKYPGHFLDGEYLRYVGWVLSDSTTLVRLEAVKALSGVYSQVDYITSLNHFTERFKPRLTEMATSDTELGIRVSVIHVLDAINGHSLLEDEERERLCILLFDEEAKVRKAVSGFVRGVWEEAVEERLVGRQVSKKDGERVGVKALAALLVKWGKALDKAVGNEDDENDAADQEGINTVAEGSSTASRVKEVAALVALGHKGRTALAVDALWDEVELVGDWEELLDVLLLDHSAAGESAGEGPRGPRANGKKGDSDDSVVDEVWRLEEVEETVLLEVLLATFRRAKGMAGGKKGEEDTVTNDITRALIKGLPRLFIKYQTDQNRIPYVLSLPLLMNLDLYLEMRMITAYANLWDDVTKQFLSHSSLTVLTQANAAISRFIEATSLSNTNSTKILELEDELSSSLRDAVAGRDEIEVASFTEDEVLALGSICARLSVLTGTRDMTAWIEEDEGGKQSSAWDIISALVERGRLGYKEEEMMIDHAIQLLSLHIVWKVRGLVVSPDPSQDEERFRETLREQRDTLLEKLVEFAVGSQSNTAEGVKRAAFQNLMTLHILFCLPQIITADGELAPTTSLTLTLDDEVQYRCAGFVQAEIEKFAETIDDGAAGTNDDQSGTDGSGDEAETEERAPVKGKKTRDGKGKVTKDADSTSRTRLEQEYIFMGVMSTFMRAIRAGAIHVRHCAIVLSHYGRLGYAFDNWAKVIVDVLREEGMFKNNGDIVVTIITQALREAFTLLLDGIVQDESHAVALSKVLTSCFIVRGAQLAVVRRLDSRFAVEIQTNLLTWAGKRFATYEANKNKKARRTAVLFFKVLLPLLATIESRDALKIKAHMDQVLAQAKVEISPASKVWEPQRAYEKRLNTAMSKDKAPGTKGRKGKAKGTRGTTHVTTDEEVSELEPLTDDPEAPPPPIPRPRPRPITRARDPPAVEEPGEQEEPEQVGEGNVEPDTSTPRTRPRPKPTYKRKSPDKSPDKSPTKSLSQSPARPTIPPPDTEDDNLPTPVASRKRARSEDMAEDGAVEGTDEQPGGGSQPASRDASPIGEMQIRRKRVRH